MLHQVHGHVTGVNFRDTRWWRCVPSSAWPGDVGSVGNIAVVLRAAKLLNKHTWSESTVAVSTYSGLVCFPGDFPRHRSWPCNVMSALVTGFGDTVTFPGNKSLMSYVRY